MSIRIEGHTAYVGTASEALDAAFLDGVHDVVIENKPERLKLERLLKGMAL